MKSLGLEALGREGLMFFNCGKRKEIVFVYIASEMDGKKLPLPAILRKFSK